MRGVLTASVLMMVLMGAGPGMAADPLEGRVVGMLSAIESMPDRDAWRALGAPAVAVLIAVANATEQPTFRRARALVALGHFDEPAAVAELERVVADDASDASLRRHAMLGLGEAAPARALPHLATALGSDDAATRQVAIKVLGASPSAEARALLRRHRDHEDRAFLTQQIDAALAR